MILAIAILFCQTLVVFKMAKVTQRSNVLPDCLLTLPEILPPGYFKLKPEIARIHIPHDQASGTSLKIITTKAS